MVLYGLRSSAAVSVMLCPSLLTILKLYPPVEMLHGEACDDPLIKLTDSPYLMYVQRNKQADNRTPGREWAML